jgi:GNAT superfamily N-acetyltransferase
MTVSEWQKGDYDVSDDPARVDLDAVHGYLATSYWAAGIPRAIFAKALAHSINFGVYRAEEQVGFARVVTDRATYAYLADVFILEGHRGRGLSKWLMECILAHPELQGLRRWALVTRDAEGLYRRYGFGEAAPGAHYMERVDRDVYRRGREPQ